MNHLHSLFTKTIMPQRSIWNLIGSIDLQIYYLKSMHMLPAQEWERHWEPPRDFPCQCSSSQSTRWGHLVIIWSMPGDHLVNARPKKNAQPNDRKSILGRLHLLNLHFLTLYKKSVICDLRKTWGTNMPGIICPVPINTRIFCSFPLLN